MVEIVGGLSLKEVVEGGTTFEVKPVDTSTDDRDGKEVLLEYYDGVQPYMNLQTLDDDTSPNETKEPFDAIGNKMTNLLPSGKIKKRVIRQGYGEKPKDGSTVKINYNAYIQFEPTPFDSTYTRKPFLLTLGRGESILGLEIAVKSMQIHEKSHFLIQPEFAYKDSGLNRIPANSVILFEIEMCDVLANPPESQSEEENSNDFENTYKYCLTLCVRGKNAFRTRNYELALKEYGIAVNKMENVLLNDYEDQIKADELLVRLYTNLLVCCTLAGKPKYGCSNFNKIYEMSKSNTVTVSARAYFNNAKCLRMLGRFDLAEKRLQEAKKIEPNNREIITEIANLRKAIGEYHAKERAFGKALVNC